MHGIAAILSILAATVAVRFLSKRFVLMGSLKTVETTSERLVIQQEPNYIGGAVPIALGISVLSMAIRSHAPAKVEILLLCGFLSAVLIGIGIIADSPQIDHSFSSETDHHSPVVDQRGRSEATLAS